MLETPLEPDEHEVPTQLGQRVPIMPFRFPFDLDERQVWAGGIALALASQILSDNDNPLRWPMAGGVLVLAVVWIGLEYALSPSPEYWFWAVADYAVILLLSVHRWWWRPLHAIRYWTLECARAARHFRAPRTDRANRWPLAVLPRWLGRELLALPTIQDNGVLHFAKGGYGAVVFIPPRPNPDWLPMLRRQAIIDARRKILRKIRGDWSLHLQVRPFDREQLEIASGPAWEHVKTNLAPFFVSRHPYLVIRQKTEQAVRHQTDALLKRFAVKRMAARQLSSPELHQHVEELWDEAGMGWLSRGQLRIGLKRLVAGRRVFRSFLIREFPRIAHLAWLRPLTGENLLVDIAIHVKTRRPGPTRRSLQRRMRYWEAMDNDLEYQQAAADAAGLIQRMRRNEDTEVEAGVYITATEGQAREVAEALETAQCEFSASNLIHHRARVSTLLTGIDRVERPMHLDLTSVVVTDLLATGSYWPYGVTLIGRAGDEPVGINPFDTNANMNMAMFLAIIQGGGKRLALDTPLATPTGWTTMGQLQLGDAIFDDRGKPCRVTYISPTVMGDSYRVRFSDGSSVVADAEHLWQTWSEDQRRWARYDATNRRPMGRKRRDRGPSVLTTAQIRDSLRYRLGRGGATSEGWNHAVLNTEPLELPEGELPVPPYTLGCWLGDGTARNGTITVGEGDEGVVEQIERDGFEVTRQHTSESSPRAPVYSVAGLNRMLGNLGVRGNKHIPAIYLRGSSGQRLALLQGLMDTDGTASSNTGAEFYSTNEALADGVFELVVSLGMKATRRVKQVTFKGLRQKDCHVVAFPPTMQVFRLGRKASRLRFDCAQQSRRKQRLVVAVEPVESVPMRCITVDSPDHLYLAGRAMVPTHNTVTALTMAWRMANPHPKHPLYDSGLRIISIDFKPSRDYESLFRNLKDRGHKASYNSWTDSALPPLEGHMGFNLSDVRPEDRGRRILELADRLREAAAANRFSNQPVLLLLDEVIALAELDEGAQFMQEFGTQGRSGNIAPVFMTQHPGPLLEHPKAQLAFANAGHVFLGRQNPAGLKAMQPLLSLDDETCAMLADADEGSGLLRIERRDGPVMIGVHVEPTPFELFEFGSNPDERARRWQRDQAAQRSRRNGRAARAPVAA